MIGTTIKNDREYMSKSMSKGLRTSSARTGKLPFHVDTKQLKLLQPHSEFVGSYIDAERKRDHLLQTRGTHQIQITKLPNGKTVRRRIPIPTSNELVFS